MKFAYFKTLDNTTIEFLHSNVHQLENSSKLVLQIVLAIVFLEALVGLKSPVTVAAGKRLSFMFCHVGSVIPLYRKSFATLFTPIAENARVDLVMETKTRPSTERLFALRTMVLLCDVVVHVKDVILVRCCWAIPWFPRRQSFRIILENKFWISCVAYL